MNEENNKKVEDQDLDTPTSEKQEQASEQEQETEEVETSEDIIAKLNEEITNLKDQRLRAIAELENFRKRAEKDQSDALKYGVSNFAKDRVSSSCGTRSAGAGNHIPHKPKTSSCK